MSIYDPISIALNIEPIDIDYSDISNITPNDTKNSQTFNLESNRANASKGGKARAAKGYPAWNKGKTGVQKGSRLGVEVSAETRAKMSASKKKLYGNGNHPHIGMKRSDEVKRNISLARKGQPSPKKGLPGKKWTEETRAKMEKRPYSWITNGTENVRADTCPDGFRKGRTFSDAHKKALIA